MDDRFKGHLARLPGDTLAEKMKADVERCTNKTLTAIAKHKAGQPARVAKCKEAYSKLGNKELAHELYNTQAIFSWCIPPRNPIAIGFSLERLEEAEQETASMVETGGDPEKFRELLVLLKDLGEVAGYEGSKKSCCLATTPEEDDIIALEELLWERFQAKRLSTGA